MRIGIFDPTQYLRVKQANDRGNAMQQGVARRGTAISRLANPAMLAAGISAVALVLSPPLAELGLQLFAAHMLQHLLLIVVASPLFVLSRAFEGKGGAAGRYLQRKPAVCWMMFTGTFLLWHWPVAFRWAAQHVLGDFLEFASIFASACVFWSAALARQPGATLSPGAAAVYVVTAAVATDLPGVVMVFAPTAICTMPLENAARFGLSPLEDQEIAGLLMWVAANLVFFAIATWLAAAWLSEIEPKTQRATFRSH